MKLGVYLSEEWNKLAKDAHLICFNENRDPETNRYDYVLCSFKEDEAQTICGYIGIQEQDKNTAYLQHGGAFPSMMSTALVGRSYRLALNYLKERYDLLLCTILNDNLGMLNLAMKEGFRVIGVDYDQQKNKVVLRLANYIYKEKLQEKVS